MNRDRPMDPIPPWYIHWYAWLFSAKYRALWREYRAEVESERWRMLLSCPLLEPGISRPQLHALIKDNWDRELERVPKPPVLP